MTLLYVTSENEALDLYNATYTIQFILTIYKNSEKLMLPGRCAPVEFFSWKCGKLRKTAKSGYLALIWPFRTSLVSALSWNKISHTKLQSIKIFKTNKDMFYKQFEFFANCQNRLWGFVNLVLNVFSRNVTNLRPRKNDIEISPHWLSATGNISRESCKSDKQTSAQHEFVYGICKSWGKYFQYLKVNVV